MSSNDENNGLAELRIGRLLDAGAICREVDHPTDEIDGHCISVWLPSSIYATLESESAVPLLRLDVLTDPTSSELLAMFILQVKGAQLRIVMPLGDNEVQRYVLDSMQRGRLLMVLADESSWALTFMRIPGAIRDPELMLRLLRAHRHKAPNVQALLQLGDLLRPLTGVASLITDQAVTQAVTVLVGHENLEAAMH